MKNGTSIPNIFRAATLRVPMRTGPSGRRSAGSKVNAYELKPGATICSISEGASDEQTPTVPKKNLRNLRNLWIFSSR